MITDQEIDYLTRGDRYPGTVQGSRNFARAIEQLVTAPLLARIEELEAKLEDGAHAVRWSPGSAYWSDELRRIFGPDARKGIDVLEARWHAALERAETAEALLRQALEALEHGAWDTLRGRNAAEAIRNHLGIKND